MSSYKIYKPYAEAVFSFAKKNDGLEKWQVFLVAASSFLNNKSCIAIINSPDLISDEKFNFLWDLLTDYYQNKKTDAVTKDLDKNMSNFLKLLFENNRIFALSGISDLYSDLLLEFNNKLSVEVQTAVELSQNNIDVLTKIISKKYNQDVDINIVLDPSLIAGLKLKIGDRVIDGSIRTKLDRLAYQLCSD